MEFEDVLVKVGDYGSYQKMLIPTVLLPASIILPWYAMSLFFMAIIPDHWCNVPELRTTNLSIADRQKLIRPPSDPKCTMYDVNYTELLMSSNWTIPHNTTTKFCHQGWEYDKTDFESTSATKWDLVCNDSYYASVVLSTADIATITGTPLYGILADKFGRRPIFFLAVFVTAVAGIAAVLVSNMVLFLVLKTIDQTVIPALFQLMYVILVELVAPEKRASMNGMANVLWTIGLCSLPLLAWLTHGWEPLGLTIACASVVFLAYWKVLPESPRWLASQGRYDEAASILLRIAKKNGKDIDRDDLMSDLEKVGERAKKQREEEGSATKFTTYILKYPHLRKKFLIISLCWTADSAAYYGLHINVTNLAGNEFINFFLLALMEFPGFLSSWYFMEKIGWRWWSVFCLTLTGFACLMPSFIPEDIIFGNTVASLIGKFGVSAAYMGVYQQASELYPTVIRTAGIAMSTTIAGVVIISIPYVVYLSKYGKFIPFLMISLICFSAGIAAAFLPETLNENLPQTLEDAEEFGKDQKFFSYHRRKRSQCHEMAPVTNKENVSILKRFRC